MKNIVLLCSQGASTSILVQKMKQVAQEMNYECEINAYSISMLNEIKAKADIILLGPQIRFQESKVKKEVSCPVKTIDMQAYGMMNGRAVMEMVSKELA